MPGGLILCQFRIENPIKLEIFKTMLDLLIKNCSEIKIKFVKEDYVLFLEGDTNKVNFYKISSNFFSYYSFLNDSVTPAKQGLLIEKKCFILRSQQVQCIFNSLNQRSKRFDMYLECKQGEYRINTIVETINKSFTSIKLKAVDEQFDLDLEEEINSISIDKSMTFLMNDIFNICIIFKPNEDVNSYLYQDKIVFYHLREDRKKYTCLSLNSNIAPNIAPDRLFSFSQGDFFFDQKLMALFNSKSSTNENSKIVNMNTVNLIITDGYAGRFVFAFNNAELNIQNVKIIRCHSSLSEDLEKLHLSLTKISGKEEYSNAGSAEDEEQTQANDEIEESKDNDHDSNPYKSKQEIDETVENGENLEKVGNEENCIDLLNENRNENEEKKIIKEEPKS